MFKIKLTQWINSEYVIVETIELPFVPFKGLMLDYPEFTAFLTGENIIWNGECFEVKLGDYAYIKK